MSQQIMPQEFDLMQDNPTIRTKCPQTHVTDEMIVKRVKNNNLSAGDVIRVQCMSNDMSELLAEAEYRVTSCARKLVTHEINDRDIRQAEEVTYKVELWTDWRNVGAAKSAPESEPAPPLTVLWNVGKRGYEVKAGGLVVGFAEDKATAMAMADGTAPLSLAA